MPRTNSVTGTPARAASTSFSMMSLSVMELVLKNTPHARPARARGNLLVYVLHDLRLDLQRGHPQDVVVVGGVLQPHVAEELHGVAADGGVGGDERQVGVEPRGLLVVVAGAQLGDVLQAVLGLARDAADLRVHLVVAEPVDHVAAGLLEALRPFDVVAFVEPGAQLEQRRDLLAFLGGGDEGLRQMRLARQPVQRDLDGDDGRVVRRLAQQLHERVHALVGVREQHLALGHLLDDGAPLVERGGPLRRERQRSSGSRAASRAGAPPRRRCSSCRGAPTSRTSGAP